MIDSPGSGSVDSHETREGPEREVVTGDLGVHIGLCSPHWPPSRGANGIVSYVAALRDHFIARGQEVSVISQERLYLSDGSAVSLSPRGTAKVMALAGDRLARLRGDASGGLPEVGRNVARQIAAAHRIRAFDLVEMEESFGWSELAASAIPAPVVTRLHGPQVLKPARHLTDAELCRERERCQAEARAIRSAAMVTAPTQAIMTAACQSYGRDPARASAVIANPIPRGHDGACWSVDAAEPGHILMVGRFDFWKGGDTMLLAFERLLDLRPDVQLTMVGPDEGLETAPGERQGFEAFAASRLSPRTRARISFRGLLKPAEILPLRMKAMATVVSSRWENFPYILLEAMACGCPLVSTDWPGADEIVIDGRSGLLTPVAEPERLALALDRLLEHPQQAAAMGAAASQRCAAEFSLDVVGDKLLACYETVIRRTQRIAA